VLSCLVETPTLLPRIHETTAAERETDHVDARPIDNAILFASPTTVSNSYYDKCSTMKKKRKKSKIYFVFFYN